MFLDKINEDKINEWPCIELELYIAAEICPLISLLSWREEKWKDGGKEKKWGLREQVRTFFVKIQYQVIKIPSFHHYKGSDPHIYLFWPIFYDPPCIRIPHLLSSHTSRVRNSSSSSLPPYAECPLSPFPTFSSLSPRI